MCIKFLNNNSLKKLIVSLFCLLELIPIVNGQNLRNDNTCCEQVPSKPGLNGLASLVLFEIGKNNPKSFLKNYYGIDPLDSLALVDGVMKLKTNTLSDSCERLLFTSAKIANSLYTFSISLINLKKISTYSEIQYISLARMAEQQLGPNGRKDAGIDKVHQGSNLPLPYTGKGVLCGLIDLSIEYTNPAFHF